MNTCTRLFFSRIQRSTALLILLATLLVVPAFAQQLQPISLPKPQITGGLPLMQGSPSATPPASLAIGISRCRRSPTSYGPPSASIGHARSCKVWAAPRPPP